MKPAHGCHDVQSHRLHPAGLHAQQVVHCLAGVVCFAEESDDVDDRPAEQSRSGQQAMVGGFAGTKSCTFLLGQFRRKEVLGHAGGRLGADVLFKSIMQLAQSVRAHHVVLIQEKEEVPAGVVDAGVAGGGYAGVGYGDHLAPEVGGESRRGVRAAIVNGKDLHRHVLPAHAPHCIGKIGGSVPDRDDDRDQAVDGDALPPCARALRQDKALQSP